MIYGSELYMVEDAPTYVYNPKDIVLNKAKYVFFDTETTGLSSHYDGITEFGGVRYEDGIRKDTLDILINPEMEIPENVEKLTNITNEMVSDCPNEEKAIKEFIDLFYDTTKKQENIMSRMDNIEDKMDLIQAKIDHIISSCIDE